MAVFRVGLGRMVGFTRKDGHIELRISARLIFRMAEYTLVTL